MRTLFLIVGLAIVLAGCTTKYDAQEAQARAIEAQALAEQVRAREEAEAERAKAAQQAALAQQLQAQAWAAQAEAAKVAAVEQRKIANARGQGGAVLIVIIFVVAGLVMWRWSLQAVAQAARPPARVQILLPSDPAFLAALRDAAAERGARAHRRGGEYYLIQDGEWQPVRQLTIKG